MDHHRIVAVFVVFFLPDLLKELLGADDLPPVLAENPENVKLDGREGQFSLIRNTFVGIPVQEKPTEVDDVLLRPISLIVLRGPS